MPEDMSHYYFDTVTLCNFALANHLDLLIARYGSRIQITSPVLDEITDGITEGYHALREIEDAVRTGVFAQAADAVLQAMVDAGYFSPVQNISGLL